MRKYLSNVQISCSDFLWETHSLGRFLETKQTPTSPILRTKDQTTQVKGTCQCGLGFACILAYYVRDTLLRLRKSNLLENKSNRCNQEREHNVFDRHGGRSVEDTMSNFSYVDNLVCCEYFMSISSNSNSIQCYRIRTPLWSRKGDRCLMHTQCVMKLAAFDLQSCDCTLS